MWIVHGKSRRSNPFLPCQGRLPRRKYINMWPSASKSSRLDCSTKEETTCTFHINREMKKNLQKSQWYKKRTMWRKIFLAKILGKKMEKNHRSLWKNSHLFPYACWCSCNAQCQWGTCVHGKECGAVSSKKRHESNICTRKRFLRRHGQTFATVIKFHRITPRLILKENTDGSPSFRHTWVSGSIYSLAKPKSTTWIHPCFLLDWL